MKVSGSGLTRGEWIAVLGGVVLAVSLVALPFFAVTVDGFVQPGLDGAAFELLDGLDVVLLQAALIPLVVPALRAGPLGARLGDGAASRVVAVAGLVAVVVTLYVMAAPPDPDVLIAGALESSADVGLAPRAGAFIGLVGSVAILAGGAIDMATTAAAATRVDVQPRPQALEATRPPASATAGLAAPLAAAVPTPASDPAEAPSANRATRKPRASQNRRAKAPAAEPQAQRTRTSASARTARAKPARPGKRSAAARKPAATKKPATAKKTAKRAAGKTAEKPAQKTSARKPATTKPRKAAAKLSFAAATESQLRGLGLTTTQARRVVRYRDELGLASGVAELEVIPGLPKATLRELKSKLRD